MRAPLFFCAYGNLFVSSRKQTRYTHTFLFIRMEKAQLEQVALPKGTVLRGNKIYTIEEAIGAGGFGITYRAT